jgi:hypothetical protein
MQKTFKYLSALLTIFGAVLAPLQGHAQNGWISLFDGKSTNGWHTYGKTTVGQAWKVEDGALRLDASKKSGWQIEGGGDILTNESFRDFHLKLEWKIAAKGNSGIIFWVQDEPSKYKYIWETGPEMQVLDNAGHPDAQNIKHLAGDLYDLISAKEGVVKPAGQWNLAEIISKKGKLTFRLNGQKVLQTTYGDDGWAKMIAGSKFKSMPDFGKKFSGHIGLQDHGDEVWYRNIMIKKF